MGKLPPALGQLATDLRDPSAPGGRLDTCERLPGSATRLHLSRSTRHPRWRACLRPLACTLHRRRNKALLPLRILRRRRFLGPLPAKTAAGAPKLLQLQKQIGRSLPLQPLIHQPPNGLRARRLVGLMRNPCIKGGELLRLKTHHHGRARPLRPFPLRDITSCVHHSVVVSRKRAEGKHHLPTRL